MLIHLWNWDFFSVYFLNEQHTEKLLSKSNSGYQQQLINFDRKSLRTKKDPQLLPKPPQTK